VLILPYIEQDNLYQTVTANITNYQNNITDNGWRVVGQVPVKTYQCPSESNINLLFTRISNGNGWARGNYAANGGPAYMPGGINGQSPFSNPAGTGNSYAAGGVMTINFGATMTQLTVEDGSSNTVMVNHVRAGVTADDPRGTWAFPLVGGSYTAGCPAGDCYTPNDAGCCSDDVVGCTDRPDIAMGCWNGGYGQANARSAHTNGVLAGMGDGSVRFVRNTIDVTTWFFMLSRNDGQTYTLN